MKIRLAAAAIAVLALATPIRRASWLGRISGRRILADRDGRARQSRRAARPDPGPRGPAGLGGGAGAADPDPARRPHPGGGAARNAGDGARPSPSQCRPAGDEDRAAGRRPPHLRSLSGTQLSRLEDSPSGWRARRPRSSCRRAGGSMPGSTPRTCSASRCWSGRSSCSTCACSGSGAGCRWRCWARRRSRSPRRGSGSPSSPAPLLFIVQASEYVANPFLYVKFAAILVGLVNVAALRLGGRLDRRQLRPAARCGGRSSPCSPGSPR